ncbi:hypothetical protein WDU94_011303 [Cyamophila willieti]
MLRASVLVFLTSAVFGSSAVFVGKPHSDSHHENQLNLVLGADKCTRGPGYWCQNISTAYECGSVKHCLAKQWRTMDLPTDNSMPCRLCVGILPEMVNLIEDNVAQEDIEDIFDKLCHQLGIPEFLCRILDPFSVDIYEYVVDTDPQVVCNMINFCNNDEGVVKTYKRLAKSMVASSESQEKLVSLVVSSLPAISVEESAVLSREGESAESGDDTLCTLCVEMVTDLKDFLVANTTETEFKHGLEDICKEMGGFSEECTTLVEQYYQRTYNFLMHELDPNVTCIELRLCPENHTLVFDNMDILSAMSVVPVHFDPLTSQDSGSEETSAPSSILVRRGSCKPCKLIISTVRKILKGKHTPAAIKFALNSACHFLPALGHMCHKFVSKYSGRLVRLLAQNLSPLGVCKRLGLCRSSDNQEIYMKETPVSPQLMIESTTKPACLVCEYILHFVQEQAADSTNEAKLLTAMDEACNLIPGEFASKCKQYVEEYGRVLIALAIQQIDPSQVCPKLNMCSTTDNAILMSGNAEASKETCAVCLRAIQDINEKILNNRTEENIKHTLDSICTSVPKHLASDCTRYINVYYDELIDMFVAETTPQEMCVYMRLCLSPQQSPTPAAPAPKPCGDSSREPITKDVEMDCTRVWGYSMCDRQVPLIMIGMLMLGLVILIFAVTRTMISLQPLYANSVE